MPRGFEHPTKWSTDELEDARIIAEGVFKDRRRNEGPKAFEDAVAGLVPIIEAVLERTNELHAITGDALLSSPTTWQLLRYVCAPPISEEDLWTLVGHKFSTLPPEFADDTASVYRDVLDSVRFPWVEEGRQPDPAERYGAVLATASLLAHERLRTERRTSASKEQEDQVATAVAAAGLQQEDVGGQLWVLDELERGHFCREKKVAGAKCDVPVRLYDGRLLALECKVSNGPKNSWKRLIREVGGKAERWRQQFGSQVVTGAVLAGVYDLSCLENAQQMEGVYIFWQHDLAPLHRFVNAAK